MFYLSHFGTYASYALLIVGMIASIVCMQYSSYPFIGQLDVSDCEAGFESSCRRSSVVLRFSFALCIMFAIQFLAALILPRFYDSFWVAKFFVFCCIVIGFFFAQPGDKSNPYICPYCQYYQCLLHLLSIF